MADVTGRPKARARPERRVVGQFEEGWIGRDGLRINAPIAKTYQDEAGAATLGRAEEQWS